MALAIDPHLLGIVVSGDLDGMTIYTDRYGRKTAFQKAPPTSPPTEVQQYQRDRFSEAMRLYAMLTPE